MYIYTYNVPLVGSLKLQVSFAKEPYKRDDILQKRPIILRSGRHVYLYIQCICICKGAFILCINTKIILNLHIMYMCLQMCFRIVYKHYKNIQSAHIRTFRHTYAFMYNTYTDIDM